MEQKDNINENTGKRITVWLLLSWFFGVMFALIGITSIFSDPKGAVWSILLSLIILPPSNDWLKKKYNISLSFGIKLILAILLTFLIGPTPDPIRTYTTNTPTTPVPQKQQVVDKKIDLKIGYRLEQKGFTVPVFEIRNESDTHWSDCKLSLNSSTYKTAMSDILTVKEFKESIPESYGSHYVMSNKFTKDDGTIFNPYTTAPKSICVSCKKPNYNINCWEF